MSNEIMNQGIIRNDITGIPDRNTYSCILEQLNTQGIKVVDKLLTQELLDQVEYLHMLEPLDLVGIEKCRNLKTLVVANTEISDISPVNGLEKLTCLSLACNAIVDITPIAEMVGLERLYLGNNHIEDISPLNNLLNLERLSLRGNKIANITALEGMVAITDLSLERNQISDISVLMDLVNLRSLNISDNQITDILALSHVHSMKYLYMGCNTIEDLSPLMGMMDLEKLELDGNKLTMEDVDQHLFQEFSMDAEWLQSNGIEEKNFEPIIVELPESPEQAEVKDAVEVEEKARPIIRREWNEDTLDLIQDKKKLSAAIVGGVAVAGVVLLMLKKKK